MPSRRWVCVMAALAGMASPAWGQAARGTAQPDRRETTEARLGVGHRAVTVDSPAAERSRATIIDRVGVGPRAKPGEGAAQEVTLHAAVLVRADAAVLRALGHESRPIEGAPRYRRIDTATVAQAIELADELAGAAGIGHAQVATSRPFQTRSGPTDPSIAMAWHLENLADPGFDINARNAWALGYSGQGVRLGIMDAGVFLFHEDLAPNHEVALSQGGRSTPHGTSVAGIAAAAGDNDAGAAGLAYNATFGQQFYYGGIEPGDIGPLTNAAGFTHANSLIDIRNNSWGPPDNSRYHPLDPIEDDALETVVTQGRAGKGGVLVWAAGNGGLIDRVDYDGFAADRRTIAIGSIGHLGKRAIYNERGSAMMAVAWSDGNVDTSTGVQRRIFTTSSNSASSYTNFFGGTSAAAPLASGAIALALEANPELTWRDVQHLVVETAQPVDQADPLWAPNAAGRPFNDNYGFGRLDALELVRAAETWFPVAPAVSTDSGLVTANAPVPDGAPGEFASVALPIDAQLRIEHAELRLRVDGTFIGDLAIELVSPRGTVSTFATARNSDADDLDHLFTSVRHWGEVSAGTWTVRVSDAVAGDTHTIVDARLVIHGTCAADQDRSGTLTPDDLAGWLSNYQAGRSDADTNGDGRVNPADFNAFVLAYSLGC